MSGKVIHTGQAIVDLVMDVAAVPQPGADVFARNAATEVGGGYNVMAAARREGAHVVYAGGHGSGPLGDLIRHKLEAEGIEMFHPPHPELDSGFCVALIDDTAERTFISTVGAEGALPADAHDTVQVDKVDVVYVTGYSLHHPANAAALARFLTRVGGTAPVVVDASPVIGDVPTATLDLVVQAATVWTVNEREARILLERVDPSTAAADLTADKVASRLAAALDALVLVRVGAKGCWVAQAGSEPVLVPGIDVKAVDTNGAGDAHTGVLCANMCLGRDLVESVRRANVAAGIAVTRRGPATSPDSTEIDAALSR
ncbi:bifunctional hydroxymethylpyrimidine kinase/phosphomethylpyrimidine kinase [Georgenia sp. EYE_87]|nr:bifunctional hydroxymethylpyrimidine kinase/phosphomethylpyrimidine kinase [Georgenia sp. EYE_87]